MLLDNKILQVIQVESKQITQAALGLGLHEVQVLPSFSLLVKTCPTKSNRVLEDINITDHPLSALS